MAFPTPYTIGRGRLLDTEGTNGYEGAPEYSSIEPVAVIGWEPLASSMPIGAELTARIITSKLLMVPPDAIAGFHPLDHVWLAGVAILDADRKPVGFTPADPTDFYVVSEDIRDLTTGPFEYKPGGAVILERTRG